MSGTISLDAIAIFLSASEAHSRKNINKSIAEALEVLEEVARAAKAEGMWVRGYVSTVFGCPYEGAVDPAVPVRIVERLFEVGIDEVSLGDTIGVANPRQVRDIVSRLHEFSDVFQTAEVIGVLDDEAGCFVVEGLFHLFDVCETASGG